MKFNIKIKKSREQVIKLLRFSARMFLLKLPVEMLLFFKFGNSLVNTVLVFKTQRPLERVFSWLIWGTGQVAINI
jgi:hypothetical protein